jgi:hypothetical protein
MPRDCRSVRATRRTLTLVERLSSWSSLRRARYAAGCPTGSQPAVGTLVQAARRERWGAALEWTATRCSWELG